MDKDLELISRVKANGVHVTSKYRSKSTGLEVIYIDMPSPVVHCEVIVATPPEDDSCEITGVKNLIFCGSDDYPQNGLLTSMANKYYSSPPYGFFVHDHTRYILRTVGAGGFCSLLPIFLDHVFFPLLSDFAFATEIHHINGEGKDGGKLYKLLLEDNPVNGWSEAMRTLFRDGTGYSFANVDDQASKLRDRCTIEKARIYHKKYYNPKNICVIIAGSVGREELFQALEQIILKLQSKGSVPKSWARPWVEELPEVCNAEETVLFPTDDGTDLPLVIIRFNGLSSLRDVQESQALQLLIEYLSVDFRVGTSPLTREFVEESELVSGGVFHCDLGSNRANITLDFLDVDMENCDQIAPKLRQALQREIDNFDLDRMNTIVTKIFDSELSSMENLPEHYDSIMEACVEYFLYVKDLNDTEELEHRLNRLDILIRLRDQPSDFWTERIRTMLLDRTWTVLKTIPSKELYEHFKTEDNKKIQERKGKLSSEDLQKFALALEKAKAEMSNQARLDKFSPTSQPFIVDSSVFHLVKQINPENIIDPNVVKCKFSFEDIPSNFASIQVVLDTSSLQLESRKYLPLFRKLITSSDILSEHNELLAHEHAKSEIEKIFLEHYFSIGLEQISWDFSYGRYSNLLVFHAKIKIENLGRAFTWLNKLFWQTQFSREKVLEFAEELLKDLKSNEDLVGGGTSESILKSLLYNDNSNVRQIRKSVQGDFLEAFITGQSEPCISHLETIRYLMHDPTKVALHIATNFAKLQEIYKDQMPDGLLPEKWMKAFRFDGDASPNGFEVTPDTDFMRKGDVNSVPPQYIISKNTDKSFLALGIPSIADYNHPDLPALLTAIQYLMEDEGPLYHSVSKKDLGYIIIHFQANEGMLYVNLEWSPNLIAAYAGCKEVIEHLITGEIYWQEELLAAAKGSLILTMLEASGNPIDASRNTFFSQILGLPQNYNEIMLSKMSQVTLEDVKLVTNKWLKDIFVSNCCCVIISPVDQVSYLREGFKPFGINLTVMEEGVVTGVTDSN